ncbi:MAG TPA: M23 family metallopeptidase [Candidatus Binatia bacterium]|nr:M23 family metallopeptidase [Candidatus Binatia bacterium]
MALRAEGPRGTRRDLRDRGAPALGRAFLLASALAGAGCGGTAAVQPRSMPIDEAFGRGGIVWPAEGRISSGFGRRGRTNHDGIDIAAPEGTPVHVVADGTVIFSGVLRGYGNTVIVEHRGGVTTVYAHNRENGVALGTRVHRGATIATIGQTGKTTGPNLHFEVRHDKVAHDPLAYLPAKGPSLVAKQDKPAKRRVDVGG